MINPRLLKLKEAIDRDILSLEDVKTEYDTIMESDYEDSLVLRDECVLLQYIRRYIKKKQVESHQQEKNNKMDNYGVLNTTLDHLLRHMLNKTPFDQLVTMYCNCERRIEKAGTGSPLLFYKLNLVKEYIDKEQQEEEERISSYIRQLRNYIKLLLNNGLCQKNTLTYQNITKLLEKTEEIDNIHIQRLRGFLDYLIEE